MPHDNKPKLNKVLIRWFVLVGILASFITAGIYAISFFINSLAYRMVFFIIAFLVLAMLIIFPVACYLAGKITIPLTRIAKKVSAYTEDFKSDVLSWSSLEEPAYEELAIVNGAFTRMGEKLTQLMSSLEKQAMYDALTGLANRWYFYQRGQEIIGLIQRNKRTCSVIFLDIDNFKKVNDSNGHKVGDEVLIQLACILEKNIRISDVAARLGGEEFAILLPDTDAEGALLLCERLRRQVEVTPICVDGLTVQITISLGVASYHGSSSQAGYQDILDKLIYQADEAMYQAKKEGRNRIELYEELENDNN